MKAEALLKISRMSVKTTFSSASQVIIDELRQKDKERDARETEKDKIIASMQAQLESVSRTQLNAMSQDSSDTRPLRGRGSRGGSRGGRSGRGGLSRVDLEQSQSQSQSQGQSQSSSFGKNPKKRTNSSSGGMTSGGFWSEDRFRDDSETEIEIEDWKVHKKKGFQKDRDEKKKKTKLSKTAKRNSEEPLPETHQVEADGRPGFPALPKSRSPVKGFEAFTLTNVPTAAAVTAASIAAASALVKSVKNNGPVWVPGPSTVVVPVASNSAALTLAPSNQSVPVPDRVPVSQPQSEQQQPETPREHSAAFDPPGGPGISVIAKVMTWNDQPDTATHRRQASQRGLDLEIRSPTKLLEPGDIVKNEKGLREEIEVELKTINGLPFSGSVTMIEAKHGIYRDCLGFRDFKNFDGVRINYKGVLVVTFKLKEAINVDELFAIQNFQFKRKSKVQGRLIDQIIECKIRGLRNQERNEKASFKNTTEGVTMVSIEGCDYRVKKEDIEAGLSHWGVLVSELKETTFEDPHDTEGTNRTGIYCIQMKMSKRIPQIIPLCGRRVKIDYRNVQKLCTWCYGPHFRNKCKENSKVQWPDYVEQFMLTHPGLPEGLFGSRQKETQMDSETKPTEEQFGVPTTKEQYNALLVELIKTGINYESAVADLSRRHEAFKDAEKKYQAAKDQNE